MVGAFTAVEGSAGYVALERVTGTLDGRKGSFILQHNGTMSRGTPVDHRDGDTGFRDGGADGLVGDDADHHRGEEALLRVRLLAVTR